MSITELPNELIAGICDLLPTDNLFSIRRSCKRLDQATFQLFSRRYYEELCLLITPRNLKFLQFVADHESLRLSVKAVYIFPGLWESWKDLELESFDYYNGKNNREMVPPKLAQARFDAYRQILGEHLRLLDSWELWRCLYEAFGQFSNLESVGLRHRSVTQDQYSRVEPLKCIDWLEIKRRTGQDPCLPPEDIHTSLKEYTDRTKVLSKLIAAVSANNIPLKSLISCSGECGSLGLYRLDPVKVTNALRTVRELHLCWTWYMKRRGNQETNARQQLMKAASASVESLYWGTVSEGLGSSNHAIAPFQRLAKGTYFQRLSKLKISSVPLSADTLPTIFSSTRSTLRSLELSHIRIEKTRSAIEGIVRWRCIFNCLAEHTHLKLVDMTRLGHAGVYWTLLDPLHGSETPNALTTREDHAVWDASRANIDLKEWANRVRFEIRPGDSYSTVDPGSYVFGRDANMDAWVRSCLDVE